MSLFSESNTVENYLIYKLSGVNLNKKSIYDTVEIDNEINEIKWKYVQSDLLLRNDEDVFLENILKDSLIKLNPDISENPENAEEVIRKLKSILISVDNIGLVKSNEEFAKWIKNEHSLPIGKNNEHTNIKLIDFENLENNSFIITNQLKVKNLENKIPDIVMFINGIPIIVGELKTPVRKSVSWYDGAYEINEVYENSIPQLFVPNILSFSSDGKELFIGAVRTPLDFWSPWRLDKITKSKKLSNLNEIGNQFIHLLNPATLLDILKYYSVYGTNNSKKIKVICRYQQFEGANAIVERVNEGKIKKGLIWHFQGSGKSLLMLFAAQKLRKQKNLNNPTVLIVVDRIDLDSQITSSFSDAEVSNFINVENIKDLNETLKKDTRKIIITMIHKFRDAPPNINDRKNIILMVDEAHRTQEGNLGRKMRSSLPNAFLFGLTGTPINKADRNTFWAFGAEEDQEGYMSRYSFQESIRDKATLPLHFEPRLPNYHIDKDDLDIAFNEMFKDLDTDEQNILSKKAAQMSIFLKSPERIKTIVSDIVKHFDNHLLPSGMKAMIVTPDRHACIQYKNEIDKLKPSNASKVVISTSPNDEFEFKKWSMDKDQQEKIVEEFNKSDSSLKFLIVTAKLLTGFDSPILQTMYLDKSLKDHTLIQAICRTNRIFPNKTFGRIVDYFGVFDDTAKALSFDEKSVKTVITNIKEIKDKLPLCINKCLKYFKNIDRSVKGFEGLEKAQNEISEENIREEFAKDYSNLSKIWEALSPDPELNYYQKDYKWLSQVYISIRPAADENGRLIWHTLGAKTTKLIHDHIHVQGINHELEEVILDSNLIDDLMNKQKKEDVKKVVKILSSRLKKFSENKIFKRLSERLEELRSKAEKGLINSVDFIKRLCEIAQETLEEEKKSLSSTVQKNAKSALTELFLEMKTDKTPKIIDRIVSDIDDIVKIVRFDGWQNSITGEREVQKSLRKTLLKYQLHKEEELFKKAYLYIKEYY